MKDTQAVIKVINQMQEAGVISKYAIGGAVGATFYIEPTSTYDIDIFIPFENTSGRSIVSLDHIFDYLRPLGYKTQGTHVLLESWPVQFLPADDALYQEALLQAVQTEVGGVKAWVMTAEHLIAIALRTGRGKDLIRIEQFVEHEAYNADRLGQILERHKLVEKWAKFSDKYLGTGK